MDASLHDIGRGKEGGTKRGDEMISRAVKCSTPPRECPPAQSLLNFETTAVLVGVILRLRSFEQSNVARCIRAKASMYPWPIQPLHCGSKLTAVFGNAHQGASVYSIHTSSQSIADVPCEHAASAQLVRRYSKKKPIGGLPSGDRNTIYTSLSDNW